MFELRLGFDSMETAACALVDLMIAAGLWRIYGHLKNSTHRKAHDQSKGTESQKGSMYE